MKAVTCEQMRELDRRTIAEAAIPGTVLMDRAGYRVAKAVRRLADAARPGRRSVIRLIAGRGNNGGDAFAAARHLREADFDVEVWLAASASAVQGDALDHLGRMRRAGVLLREFPGEKEWDAWPLPSSSEGVILVDGLLGTGSRGAPQGAVARAIRWLNAAAANSLVVAIDIPSGLDGDTGAAPGDAVVADVTVTLAFPKVGLLQTRAVNYIGSLEVMDIGIPAAFAAGLSSELELIAAVDLRRFFGRRPNDAHKGTYGHVLLVGGAAGYAGAIAFAAQAAARSGVGRVTALVPTGIASTVAALVPEAMVHAAPQTESGSLAAGALEALFCDLGRFTSVLAGPGMTPHADTGRIVRHLLAGLRVPLILDADALNVLGQDFAPLRASAAAVVLTPHPGEMARLMGCTNDGIQADRAGVVRRAAEQTRATIVLKGAGTLVAAADTPLHVNLTGNPGMATGGMGDVLAGLIAGLAAQGMAPFDAARAGVYLHGCAGDIAARRLSQAGMTAPDVIAALPAAFRELSAR